MNKFKVGDRVEWCGVEGVVTSNDAASYGSDDYKIMVYFEDLDDEHGGFYFTEDGKYHTRHKEPSIKLLPPKKKLTLHRYWYKYPDGKINFYSALECWDYIKKILKVDAELIKTTIVEEVEIDD